MNLIEKKSELMSVLNQYKRWDSDGRKKYGYGPGEQLRYDTYHNYLAPTECEGTYRFCIQVYDSPEVDIWWHGEFRTLNGGTDVEIIKEGSERR